MTDPARRKDLMWDFTRPPGVMSLAVNDSFQLDIKALDYYGNIIVDDVSVQYQSGDTSKVKVDSTGLIRAVRSTNGQGIAVIVWLRAGQVTRQTGTSVGVTPTRVRVDSISVTPEVGEPILTLGSFGVIRARALDSVGNEVPGVYTEVQTADGSQGYSFLFGNAIIRSLWEGYIKSSLFINGRMLTDSVYYRTRYRDQVDVTVGQNAVNGTLDIKFASAYNTNIYISPNGQVTFINNLKVPMDVTFEQPDSAKGSASGAVGGNIVALAPRRRVSRWFPSLGDYFFTIQAGADSQRVSVTVKDIPPSKQ